MRFRKIEGRTQPRWKTPVWVEDGIWRMERIASPAEALEKLVNRWPLRQGRHYRSAITSCEAAISCQYSGELAKEAFLRAGLEAALLVGGGTSDSDRPQAGRVPTTHTSSCSTPEANQVGRLQPAKAPQSEMHELRLR
jgi:hypothetical protein